MVLYRVMNEKLSLENIAETFIVICDERAPDRSMVDKG